MLLVKVKNPKNCHSLSDSEFQVELGHIVRFYLRYVEPTFIPNSFNRLAIYKKEIRADIIRQPNQDYPTNYVKIERKARYSDLITEELPA
jgi:hypothetical protein